jgi:methylthioribose-1-phosphate isomerase
MARMPPTLQWIELPDGPALRLIDQTRLPNELAFIDCVTLEQVAEAIKVLRVRGAPAIGCAAAFGLALVAARSQAVSVEGLRDELKQARDVLAATRPTAVNLFWALDRVVSGVGGGTARQGTDAPTREELVTWVVREAQAIMDDDLERCRSMGRHGAELIPSGANVLTHCNAGALATAGYGTALGVIRAAHEAGKGIHVWVDETRPLLQGARLTAWELVREGIPATVIADNMAGSLMRAGKIDCAVVGSDRIAGNGDVANKIGTYSVARLCQAHDIPFYVAAPFSTVDLSLSSGDEIPIEQRDPDEISLLGHLTTRSATPEGVGIYNPAFDVTPAELVAAIITERGVLRPPYVEALRRSE